MPDAPLATVGRSAAAHLSSEPNVAALPHRGRRRRAARCCRVESRQRGAALSETNPRRSFEAQGAARGRPAAPTDTRRKHKPGGADAARRPACRVARIRAVGAPLVPCHGCSTGCGFACQPGVGSSQGSGTWPDTCVPCPGAESMVSVPPIVARRSRMCAIPRPVRVRVGSKPAPESRTVKRSPSPVSVKWIETCPSPAVLGCVVESGQGRRSTRRSRPPVGTAVDRVRAR